MDMQCTYSGFTMSSAVKARLTCVQIKPKFSDNIRTNMDQIYTYSQQ